MAEFAGLDAFLATLPQLAARLEAAQQTGRVAAVAVVHREVLAAFADGGADDPGPFPAPPALQEATQQARLRHGFAADALELATGTLRDSVCATVEADGRAAVGVPDAVVGSGAAGDAVRNIGDVAVAQEEGGAALPQRAFLGIAGFRAAEAAAEAFVAPVVAALAGTEARPPSSEGDARHGDD